MTPEQEADDLIRDNANRPEQKARAHELLRLLGQPDVAALRKGVEWVEEQAALPGGGAWKQSVYVQDLTAYESNTRGCGTAYCLAGYVASVAHPELMHQEAAWVGDDYVSSRDASDTALGLTDRHHLLVDMVLGRDLYTWCNTATQIREIAELMAGEKL